MTLRRLGEFGVLAALAVVPSAPAKGGAEMLRFRMDPQATEVSASVAEAFEALRGAAWGHFRVLSGEVSGDRSDVAASGKVSLVIDAASYHSDSGMRDRIVKGSALAAEKFPAIRFESTAVEQLTLNSETSGAADVVGKLTLHGTTRELKVPVYASLDDSGKLVADGETTFRYEDFNVKRPSAFMGLMQAGDQVTVKFHVVASPVPAPK